MERQQQDTRPDPIDLLEEAVITNFPMQCPCCRRPFILGQEDHEPTATNSEMTNSELGDEVSGSSVDGNNAGDIDISMAVPQDNERKEETSTAARSAEMIPSQV